MVDFMWDSYITPSKAWGYSKQGIMPLLGDISCQIKIWNACPWFVCQRCPGAYPMIQDAVDGQNSWVYGHH